MQAIDIAKAKKAQRGRIVKANGNGDGGNEQEDEFALGGFQDDAVTGLADEMAIEPEGDALPLNLRPMLQLKTTGLPPMLRPVLRAKIVGPLMLPPML
jgi:hypothetical protein